MQWPTIRTQTCTVQCFEHCSVNEPCTGDNLWSLANVWATLKATNTKQHPMVIECTENTWDWGRGREKDACELPPKPVSSQTTGPLKENPSLCLVWHRGQLPPAPAAQQPPYWLLCKGRCSKQWKTCPPPLLHYSKLSWPQLLQGWRLSEHRSLQIKEHKLWVSGQVHLSLWPRSCF